MSNINDVLADNRHFVPKAKRTYGIVSHIAYLIGVKREFFELGKLQAEVFDRLDKHEAAHRIRALCRIRNSLMRNFLDIENALNFYLKNLDALPQYIDPEDIQYLHEHGVPLLKSNTKTMAYLMSVNQHIANNIHSCSELFPLWIEWPFVRSIFLMPESGKEVAVKRTSTAFSYNSTWFPFQCYINWNFTDDDGNILHYDAKFVTLLYMQNGKIFSDYRKVIDAGHDTQAFFHNFIAENEKVAFLVDCENSDPYSLCATFRNINAHHPEYVTHISKIILYDDEHSVATWRVFDRYVGEIPVEHKMIKRLQNSKSLVDISMTAGACEEHFKNGTEAFVIVSSDSDFWGLISALPDAQFLVMLEHGKQSTHFLEALEQAGIFYCYIDKFSQGDINDIKTGALLSQASDFVRDKVCLNINDLMTTICKRARIQLSPSEEKAFKEKYINRMKLIVDLHGDVTITLS